MAASRSTQDILLSLIDDIELISKALIENTIAERHQKLSSSEHLLITELLVLKDRELRITLEKAADQVKTHERIEALRGEIDKQDQHIQQFQRQLKKCEEILATAVFQAKQIIATDKHPVASEDIIKFAFGISASNGVCAPLTWQPGDRRRPYPTDLEMRSGHLGGLSDLGIEQLLLQLNSLTDDLCIDDRVLPQQGSFTDIPRTSHALGAELPASQQNLFICHPSGEIHMPVGGQGTVTMDTRNRSKDAEDVEVMSTDSSSGSSSFEVMSTDSSSGSSSRSSSSSDPE